MRTAEIKVGSTRNLARQNTAVTLAQMNEQRDNALADADVALKRAALNKALEPDREYFYQFRWGGTASPVAAACAWICASTSGVRT